MHLPSLALALTISLVLGACAEEPLPQQPIRRDNCLRNVQLDRLQEQLKQCDDVVAAFPKDPAPLNDRYLLHSLAGNDAAACADLKKALRLAKTLPAKRLDAQLRSDLEVRKDLCNLPEG